MVQNKGWRSGMAPKSGAASPSRAFERKKLVFLTVGILLVGSAVRAAILRRVRLLPVLALVLVGSRVLAVLVLSMILVRIVHVFHPLRVVIIARKNGFMRRTPCGKICLKIQWRLVL